MNLCRKAVLLFTLAALSVMLMSFTCAASENTGDSIDLYVNSVPVEGAMLVNGTAYAPYRILISAIDPAAAYDLDGYTRASIASGEGIEIRAYADEHYIEANERVLYNETAKNLTIEDVLYIPIRSAARAYSLNCEWSAKERAVYLNGEAEPILSGDEYYDQDVLYWLSRIISAESRGEPMLGQIAVGNVVLNRTEDGSFPDTVYGVIFDRKNGTQFSPVSSGTIYNDPTEDAVRAAKIVLEGVEVVEDALFFCANRVNSGSWMAQNREYVETIGNHVFYA